MAASGHLMPARRCETRRASAFYLLLVGAFAAGMLACGGPVDACNLRLVEIKREWAQIKYRLPPPRRAAAFARLRLRIEDMRRRRPGDACLWLWNAVVLANEAGARHAFSSIGMIRKARIMLEKAIAIDPQADGGLAQAFLGDLYHSMPPWPLGFGDDNTAGAYLRRALRIAPRSLDANYFMGTFLFDNKHFAQAAVYLRRALKAPPRPGLEVADAGRKADAARLLRQALEKLKR